MTRPESTSPQQARERSERLPAGGRSLTRHTEQLAVVSLPVGAEIPVWAESSSLFSVTATATGTTMVCSLRNVPEKYAHPGPYLAFEMTDQRSIDDTGVISTLTAALAEAGISVFVLSTFHAEWFLVRESDADAAHAAWDAVGHRITVSTVERGRS